MSLPSIEISLLRVYQNLGCGDYRSEKKADFGLRRLKPDNQWKTSNELLDGIFRALGLDSVAQHDARANLVEMARVYRIVERHTCTYGASQRQALWQLLGCFYVPGLARYAANWTLDGPLDTGMPGGQFWYLPQIADEDDKPVVVLPVAQVLDWLWDLVGAPIEPCFDQGTVRSLYNWRWGTTPAPDKIRAYFPDDRKLPFAGAFYVDDARPLAQQVVASRQFVTDKGLTAEALRLQIPMDTKRIQAVLNGHAEVSEQVTFVACLAARYSAPSMAIIRRRLLIARAVQEGYRSLVKILCPDVKFECADLKKNKVLQLLAVYRHVYNLAVEAGNRHPDAGGAAQWFEDQLKPWERAVIVSILPPVEMAEELSRYFANRGPNDELEDIIPWGPQAQEYCLGQIARWKEGKAETYAIRQYTQTLMAPHPDARSLASEERFWVLDQLARSPYLDRSARALVIRRLRAVASAPWQAVHAILLELGQLLDEPRGPVLDDCTLEVEALLQEAERNENGLGAMEGDVLQYRAKHRLAKNDTEGAKKDFRQAHRIAQEHSAALRWGVARDLFALEVATAGLNPNNHENLFQDMRLFGAFGGDGENSLEEAARLAVDYFWETMYKHYPGVKPLIRSRS